MMRAFCALQVLASTASAQVGSAGVPPAGSYAAVMHAQYSAQTLAPPQRSEEAQRVYDAYLNALAQKNKAKTNDSVGNTEDQPR